MSYQLSDMKWGAPTFGAPSGRIDWIADLSSGLNYNTSLYSQADFNNALGAAFDKWEDVASVDFERVASASAAEVTFGMAPLAGATVGRAAISFAVLPGTDRILSGDIDLDSTVTWSPFGESGGTNFYAVALHEIGHVLGLEHVNDRSEIMNPVISTSDLGDGDITGIQLLYGADPGDAGPGSGSPTPPSGGSGSGATDEDDDGGGGGTGLIALVLGAILALIAAILGGGGAAVGMAVAAGEVDEDGEDADDETGGSDAPATVAATTAPGAWAGYDHDTPLDDLIPMLEEDGIEIATHGHGTDDCTGCCGGACGDPVHMAEAMADFL
jgi:hypothetical protein